MRITTPFLVCALMTAISAFVSLGFSLGAVPGTVGQTRTLAFYTCIRSIAFAIVSLVSFANVPVSWPEAVAAGLIIVQVGDAVIGVRVQTTIQTCGPAATAIIKLGDTDLIDERLNPDRFEACALRQASA